MREQVRCVALITHQLPSMANDTLAEVLPFLQERGLEVLVPPGEQAKHPEILKAGASGCCETSREELARAGLCLVLGGDGTMLRALSFTRDLGLPVIGVNLGRVGYLTAIRRDRLQEDLGRLLDGDYATHSLAGLAAEANGASLRAVNDIVVSRGRDAGICEISYALNGVTVFQVRCDALIAATPAGSTAYNLAAGGPVLGIDVEAYVVTYVAPHTLAVRPVVASFSDVLEVRNESSHQHVDVMVDGERRGSLHPLSALEVRTAPDVATLALLPDSNFYQRFRERFV